MTTYTSLDEANKLIEELDGKLGEESLKVIELQGKLEGRRLIIEDLTKEIAVTRSLVRDVLVTVIEFATRIGAESFTKDVRAEAKAAGFDV